MKPTLTEIERLEMSFRSAPAAPGHMQVDVYNLIEEIGGEVAIKFGMWCATPYRNRWQKRDRGLVVADALHRAAIAKATGSESVTPKS